jgi:iron complex outermembrane recepter protein
VSALALSASAAALGLAIGASTTARAQAVTTTPAVEAPSAIVVITAERRTVNLQKAPVAATVLSGVQLEQRGVYNVDQLQFTTPSLTVTNYSIGEDYNIRGIGKEEVNIQTPSGIVVYRDGVATFPGFFTAEPYYDIANVEVLRGPQGTFAGQNASGGAIFITEADPNFSGYHGSVEAQYGDYNDVRLRAVLNAPVNDTFAVRVALNGEREDSFYSVSGPHSGDPGALKEANGRISLLWQPNKSLEILFKNDFNYIDYGGWQTSLVPIPPGPTFPSYASSQNLFNVKSDIKNYNYETFDRSVLNIGYTFDDGIVLRSISGYQIGRLSFNEVIDAGLAGNTFDAVGNEQIGSEEVDLVSPETGRLKWVAGGYYQHDEVTIPFGVTGFDINTPPLQILLKYDTPKVTEAAFGQVSYDITNALQVVAGGRYTHSTFTLNDVTSVLLFGLPGADFGLPAEVAHAVQNDDKVTGKIDLNWKLDDNNFLYALVATGHKPGGINTTPVPFGPHAFPVHPFLPENLTDYEIGWKPTAFDGHLHAQLDAFYTTYQSMQLTLAFTGGAAPGQSIIQNVPGTTVIYGVEGQAQAVFGPWSFDVSADYLHSSLGSTAGTCTPTGGTSPSCIAGALRGIDGVGFESISGVQQPYAPEWNVNFGVQYVFHLGDGSTLTPRLDYGFVDSQWASPFQAAPIERYLYHLAPENLLSGQIAWTKGSFQLTLYGTNLLNDHYFAEDGTGATALDVLRDAAPPLQFGIRASKDF